MSEQEKKTGTRAQLMIALVSALIPIILTLVLRIFEKDSKEISIYYTEPKQILVNTSTLEDRVDLFYDSVKTENISSFQLVFINSGNQFISKEDFVDGPIQILIKTASNPTEINLPRVLHATKVDDAKQRNSELNISSMEDLGIVEYLPSLMNPNDRVLVEVYVPSYEKLIITYNGKIKEGYINTPTSYSSLVKVSRLKALILSMHEFFAFKALTILTFVFLFALMAIGTFAFLAMMANEDDSPLEAFARGILGGKIIFIVMLITTIIHLFFLVLVTIY